MAGTGEGRNEEMKIPASPSSGPDEDTWSAGPRRGSRWTEVIPAAEKRL